MNALVETFTKLTITALCVLGVLVLFDAGVKASLAAPIESMSDAAPAPSPARVPL